MMVFWVLVAGLIGLALLFILLPLLRAEPRKGDIDPNQVNLALFQQQLAELETDLAAGNLDRERYAAARRDLEKELLLDIEQPAATAKAVPIRSGRWAAVALAGLVPLLSVSLYLGIGDPSAVAPVARPAASQAQGMPPMEDLVAKLAKRMESQPNNVEGWVMLGRSYLALERVDDAVRAIEKARALAPDEPEILLALAEAIARGQRSLSGRALELIRQALVLQPDHPNGNWMLGLAEFQQDHFAEAIGAWSRLEGTLDPGSEDAQTLQSYLQEARQRTGGGAPAPAPTAAAATATTAGNPVGIEVEVSLAPELAAQVAPEDTLFVFARAAQGSPMPLAVQRRQVKDLPLKLRLDDSMALQPQLRLSAFPQVLVGARISKAGSATPQSGDLQGEVAPVASGQPGTVKVKIDTVRP